MARLCPKLASGVAEGEMTWLGMALGSTGSTNSYDSTVVDDTNAAEVIGVWKLAAPSSGPPGVAATGPGASRTGDR